MIRDNRLLPAAVITWAIAAVGLTWGWLAALCCGSCAVLVAAVVAVGSLRWRPAAVLVVVLGITAMGFVCAAVRASAEHPVRGFADRGSPVVIRAEVTERPILLHTPGFGGRQGSDRVEVTATLRSARVDDSLISDSGRIVILAPADSWRQLLPGQSLTAAGKLGPARPGQLAVAVVQINGPPTELTSPPIWERVAADLRDGLRQAASVLPDEAAGLLPGLVDGDSSGLSSRVADEFTAAGMSHLIAVSGANLAIVSATVLFLLRLLQAGPVISACAAGVAVSGFVLFAGGQPSVLRAAVMGLIGLVGLAIGRERTAVSALATTLVVLVLMDPELALNAGFILSILATGSLVLVAPRWASALHAKGLPRRLADALAVPAAAHLVTAPVIVGISGQVSLVAIGANMLAEPVIAPATVLGVLATLIFPLWHSAANVLVQLAGPETEWLITVARHAAGLPMATVNWPAGWLGGALLAGLIAGLVLALRLRKFRIILAAVLVGLSLVIFPTRLLAPSWPPTSWAVVSCDVGQGDALVLATGEPGQAVVVDTGPELTAITSCLSRLGIHRIAAVLLSHLHADHVGGLPAVLSDYPVGAIGVGAFRQPEWAWNQVCRDAALARVPIIDLATSQRFSWPDLTIDVLASGHASGPASTRETGTVINDASVVLAATTRVGRVLLTGDIELAGQAELLSSHFDLHADILKVPHHGSRYSLPQFLAEVHPRVALISVGAGNPFGHPSSTIINALTENGVTVLRTDHDGDIAVLPGQSGPAVARRGDPRGPPRG